MREHPCIRKCKQEKHFKIEYPFLASCIHQLRCGPETRQLIILAFVCGKNKQLFKTPFLPKQPLLFQKCVLITKTSQRKYMNKEKVKSAWVLTVNDRIEWDCLFVYRSFKKVKMMKLHLFAVFAYYQLSIYKKKELNVYNCKFRDMEAGTIHLVFRVGKFFVFCYCFTTCFQILFHMSNVLVSILIFSTKRKSVKYRSQSN